MKTDLHHKTDTQAETLADIAHQMGVTVVRIFEDPDRLLIRRQLALPSNKRTHFIRKQLPTGGSAI
jgi:hypothetical protein